MKTVAVLFARADSIYKGLPGTDVFDKHRDARTWAGGSCIVAHPPCRLWGKLQQFAGGIHETEEALAAEKAMGPWAVEQLREWGGILEHPAESKLWAHCGLPRPGRAPDWFGGWTAEIDQCDFGHRAEKRSWFYIVGVHPDDLPALPPPGQPTGLIKPMRGVPRDGRKILTKRERDATPPALAEWLLEVARLSSGRPDRR